MDQERFDTLTRTLSTRRKALGGLLGGVAGLLGLAADGAAHNALPACAKRKTARQQAACRRRARKHNRTHQCQAQPLPTTCASRCGVWKNNCNQPTACYACPPGRSCLANGSCAEICTPGFCPASCSGCGYPNTEGVSACIAAVGPCPTVPCTRTADCPVGYHCQACDRGGPTVCFPLCAS